MKNKLIILCIIGAIIIIGISIFINIQIEKKEDSVALTLKENLDVEFGSDVKVSDFIEDLQGELIEDNKINTGEIGTKKVTFNYKSIRKKKKTKTFEINIIDTVKPMIYMNNTLSVKKGYSKDILDLVFSGDNADSTPERKIIGEYDLNTVGDYNLTYSIKDKSGNEETKDFVLKVIDENNSGITGDSKKTNFKDIIQQYKKDDNKIGLDVSQWQGNIDFAKIKDAGVEFVIIRLGYQKDYDDEDILDPQFIKNITGAKEAGLDVGLYFYSYAKTKEEAERQANFVIDNVKEYEIDLPIAFDWESWNSFIKCNLSFYNLNQIAHTFINILEQKGYKGSLYGSKNFLERVWYEQEFDNIWLAHYTRDTDYDKKYYLWQLCNNGKIDGINGDVDIDILYKK